MDFRYMGKTGLKVTELCLGTAAFGREVAEEESVAMMNAFAEAGGNFIDTADVYTAGVSEQIVGRWLKDKRRSDWIIATKIRFPMGQGPNDAGLSRKHILDGVEASLRRLATDYIDLYQVHCWDRGTPLEETLRTLDGLVRSGKVRYLGVSNYTGWQLQKAIDLSHQMGLEPFTCLQPLYNLLERTIEWELIPVCLNEGVGIIPWSPLRGGWLSGKYRRGMEAPVPGTRVEDASKFGWGESWANMATERTWRILDALHEVAAQAQKTPAQVALRWLLQRPGVTAPIIGARTLSHLTDNLGATGWQLGEEHMARLTQVSEPPMVYPYDFISSSQGDR